ncbi:MAG: winged helix-turn-helix domain-containing protein [Spirochaetota bacterium]
MYTENGLEIPGKVFELLKLISETGSINTAVRELGVSYSYAWNTLNRLNCKLDTPIVVTRRGGNGGGVSTVTEAGLRIVDEYDRLRERLESVLEGGITHV